MWQKWRETGETDMRWVTTEAAKPAFPQDLVIQWEMAQMKTPKQPKINRGLAEWHVG